MKDTFLQKHADFFLLFVMFAFPPVLNSKTSSYSASMPVLMLLVYTAVCIYILCKTKFKKSDFTKFSFLSSAILLISLFINGAVWNLISSLFVDSQEDIQRIMPDNLLEKLYVGLSIFVSALYEELLYRQFLPDGAVSIISQSAQSVISPTVLRFASEIVIIAIFALGHRYLGGWAVVNALCAGVMLRIFCIRTGSFLSGFIAHYVYNMIVFFLFLQ